MASVESRHGSFTFPLELIQLIIDEVSTDTLSNPRLRADTLCALSCVCQAFYFPARAELLSAITFSTSPNHQVTLERAAILVQVLQKNQAWGQGIRSMTLTINHSLRRKPKSSHALTPVIGRLWTPVIGRRSSSLTTLLDIALRSPSLEKFVLEGWDGGLWPCNGNDLKRHGISTILHEIRASPRVKSLTIVNIHDMPWDLVLSPFASSALHEMTFINSTPDLWAARDSADHTAASNTVSRIKILTLLNLPYVDFFLGLRSYFPELPAGMVSKSPSIYFTSLHTLRFNIPAAQYDAETLAKFLLGVAGTLETSIIFYDLILNPF